MADPILIAKAAATLLTNEKARKGIGWIIAAIFSPVILVVALLLALGSGASSHNSSVAQLCFQDGEIPDGVPAEYRVCIETMRTSFAELDAAIAEIQANMEDGGSLDPIRVKAVFFALYFGGATPDTVQFAGCFAVEESRTRTVIETDDGGNETEVEQTYTVYVPITDMETVYANIAASLGVVITEEQKSNADSVYSLIRYGYPAAAGAAAFAGADVPYTGEDGFCSPVGVNWRDVVTSEFGSRADPITGRWASHSGIDLAVPSGTPIRAALDGVVTLSKYYGDYGYCVMIDHGGGLTTLYGHNSRLLAAVDQTVQAGDVVSLSGSTGRSTGPHLHFEVRVNGERTDPRYYLP